MLYSLIEKRGSSVRENSYNDWNTVLDIAMINTRENIDKPNYWCKIYQKDLDVDCFFSEDLVYLTRLYKDKIQYGEDIARRWVHDEICQYGQYKLVSYIEYMESIYGEK